MFQGLLPSVTSLFVSLGIYGEFLTATTDPQHYTDFLSIITGTTSDVRK